MNGQPRREERRVKLPIQASTECLYDRTNLRLT